MAIIKLRILGECVIEVGDRCITPESPQLFGLLLYLGVESNRKISRGELSEVLFGEGDTQSGRTSHRLRQLLYRARRLGAPLMLADATVSLGSREVENDIDSYLASEIAERLARKSGPLTVLPRFEPEHRIANQWVESVRDRYHTALRRQLTTDLQFIRQGGDWQTLELLARQLLALDALSETATLYMAEALARNGSKAMAISLLQQYERDVPQQDRQITLPSQVLRKRIATVSDATQKSSTKELPFVGRIAAMQQIGDSWVRTRRGTFSTVLVAGEKSIGKSRLCEEFTASVRLDGTGAIVRTSLTSGDSDRPLSLFVRLAGQLLSLPGAAGCGPDNIQLLRRLTDINAPVGPVGSYSQPLYDEASIRLALQDLLASVCEERALLCAVDNCDELDEASLTMLQAVQTRISGSRALFLLAGRLSRVQRELSLTTIHLQALRTDAARTLLAHLIPQDIPQAEETTEWILEVAAGNPGHLELLATMPLARGNASRIPTDLIALNDQRLASLSQHAQHVLQALAVVSEGATGETLGALTGLSEYFLLSSLEELEQSSLLKHDERGLACRSTLIAERALVAASPAVLMLMHERAARQLEIGSSGRPADAGAAWRTGHHWKLAKQPQKARDSLRACWQQAINVGRPLTACDAIRREIAVAQSLEDRAALLDDLIGALQAAGDNKLIREVVEERQALSVRLSDSPHQCARLSFDHLCATAHNNRKPLAIDFVLASMRSGYLDRGRRLRACRMLMIAADIELNESLAAQTYDFAGQVEASDLPSMLLQQDIALFFHAGFGDRDEALRVVSRIEALHAGIERSWLKSTSRRNCSLARLLLGTGSAAIDRIEEDYFESIDASLTRPALFDASHLASALIDSGDHERAREWLARADELTKIVRPTELPVDYVSAKVDIAVIDGNPTAARKFILEMQKNADGYLRGRLRNDCLIYRLRVQQAFDDQVPTDAEIGELITYHHAAKRLGRHDDHMAVLWASLRLRDRSAEASALLATYLSEERRERRECRYMLRVPTAIDPAWTLPSTSAVATPRH